ncbi:MAG TPA: hypothetical protein VF572_02980 [Candidatus Saccharimonadales bacterium]|jgi:hypothetical protein
MYRTKISLLVSIFLLIFVPVLLIFTAPADAQAVTQAYSSDNPLQRGMIVRITEKDKNKVEALSDKAATKMEGIIVAANDSPVTLSSEDVSKQQVFVAKTGKYNLLVGNQNGPIKVNDLLTISSLAGIAMKADTKQPVVVGKALAAFDGKTSVSGSTTVKDSAGRSITVAIGLLPVDINISRNPLEKQTESRIPGVGFLQSGARAIVNKTVDPARLYISLLVLLVVAAIAGSILYGGVRSSMVSIGRNPLAKSSIMRGLIQVVITSIIIFIIGLIGVYLILKL